MENQTKSSVEIYSVGFCHLLDYKPNINGTDCSTTEPSKCIRCPVTGTYVTGESINDYGSTALKYYYAIWIVICAVSFVGLFNNVLILVVMKRRRKLNSFDVLLSFLATFDAFASLFTTLVSTACAAYFGNWFGRGKFTMYWYLHSLFGVIFWRSGSNFTTVLITIERFIMITFPFKANLWFTVRNTKILAFIVLTNTSLLSVPRFFGHSVEYNEYNNISTLQGLEYVVKPNAIGIYWYRDLRALHNLIDFWMPLPFIVLFNLLSLWKVHQLNKKRKQLSLKVKREIRTIKMFLPVVLIYFMTNIGPILIYVFIHFYKRAYREIYQIGVLSIALNSVANLPIYYYTSSVFKGDIRKLVEKLVGQRLDYEFQMREICDKTGITSVSSASNLTKIQHGMASRDK